MLSKVEDQKRFGKWASKVEGTLVSLTESANDWDETPFFGSA